MPHRLTNFSQFLAERHRRDEAQSELVDLLEDVQRACKFIAAAVAREPFVLSRPPAERIINVQGEEQKPLDLVGNEIMLRLCERSGRVGGMVSEELAEPYAIPEQFARGRHLLLFDPLDGSGNVDLNMTIGTIFSVLRLPESVAAPALEHYLRPGREQVAAGFALFGPTTMLILTLGQGVHGFTLERDSGSFLLTHPDLRIPSETREFAINASNARFWEPPVRRYVEECLAGKAGPRGADFNMRWIASMVAEVHRILIRGGVYLYPRDAKAPVKAGRLRLLYEANPMAMVVEQAGGAASTGRERLLDLVPGEIHQRVPVILGSRDEVERLVRYHDFFDRGEDVAFSTPLFNTRSLFRGEAVLPRI